MAQYIDKSAVIAEIERLISNGQVKLQESQESNDNENYIVWSEHIATCIKVLSLLDTLEVKDVNCNKEIGMYTTKELLRKKNKATNVFHLTQGDIDRIAKHFFELGLKNTERRISYGTVYQKIRFSNEN